MQRFCSRSAFRSKLGEAVGVFGVTAHLNDEQTNVTVSTYKFVGVILSLFKSGDQTMCMTSQKEISLTEVSAFKLFTRDLDGRLRSAFAHSFKNNLFYPSNERIRVDDESSTFFAFANKKQAIGFGSRARKTWYGDSAGVSWRWNIVNGHVIVLPVTMFEVVREGKFHVPSGDIQTMDGYYPAFESKEIIVHDTEDIRNEFYDEILYGFFKNARYGMSAVEKEALNRRLPRFAECISG